MPHEYIKLKMVARQKDAKGNIEIAFSTETRINNNAQVLVQWDKALTVDLIKKFLGVDVLTKKPSPTGAYATPLLNELERRRITLVIE